MYANWISSSATDSAKDSDADMTPTTTAKIPSRVVASRLSPLSLSLSLHPSAIDPIRDSELLTAENTEEKNTKAHTNTHTHSA